MHATVKHPVMIAFAATYSGAILALGYIMLGLLPALLFALGFIGGFLLWVAVPAHVSFEHIRTAYWITLILFAFHKIEERYMDFFPALSKITGVPMPDTSSPMVFALYALSSAWLLIPYLMKRGHEFGWFLAWTFFTSMGVSELAHFVFPLLTDRPYGYFPGMVTVIPLAPMAWWGLIRLKKPSTAPNEPNSTKLWSERKN